MNDIRTVADRAKLEPRREPYWRAEGEAYLGFRCIAAGGAGTWIGRIREDGKQNYQALGQFAVYRQAA